MAIKRSLSTKAQSSESGEGLSQDNVPRTIVWNIVMLSVGLALLVPSSILALMGLPRWEAELFALVNQLDLPSWVGPRLAEPLSDAVWGMVGLVAIMLLIPRFSFRAWQYAVGAGATYAVVFVLEHLIGRARPIGFDLDTILRAAQGGPGFPSGHVAVLVSLVILVWKFIAWPWRLLLAILIAGEVWSRIFLGLHLPLDVIGSIGVSLVVISVIRLMPLGLRRFFRIAI